jgi:hypothetical protein
MHEVNLDALAKKKKKKKKLKAYFVSLEHEKLTSNKASLRWYRLNLMGGGSVTWAMITCDLDLCETAKPHQLQRDSEIG